MIDLNIMGWVDKPYWLRGAIILGVFYIICLVLFLILNFGGFFQGKVFPDSFFFNVLGFISTVIYIVALFPLLFIVFMAYGMGDSNNVGTMFIIIAIIGAIFNLIFYSGVGAAIGAICGLFKHNEP